MEDVVPALHGSGKRFAIGELRGNEGNAVQRVRVRLPPAETSYTGPPHSQGAAEVGADETPAAQNEASGAVERGHGGAVASTPTPSVKNTSMASTMRSKVKPAATSRAPADTRERRPGSDANSAMARARSEASLFAIQKAGLPFTYDLDVSADSRRDGRDPCRERVDQGQRERLVERGE